MTDTNQTEWTDEEITRQIETFAPVEQLRAETEPRAISARYDRESGLVFIQLKTGATFSFPAHSYRFLKEATEDELEEVVVSCQGETIEWPAIDVGAHLPGLILHMAGSPEWCNRLFEAEWDHLQKMFPKVAAEMGRKGGSVKSPAKAKASAENGKKGGRPRREQG